MNIKDSRYLSDQQQLFFEGLKKKKSLVACYTRSLGCLQTVSSNTWKKDSQKTMEHGSPFPIKGRPLISSRTMQYSIELIKFSLDLFLISKDIKLCWFELASPSAPKHSRSMHHAQRWLVLSHALLWVPQGWDKIKALSIPSILGSYLHHLLLFHLFLFLSSLSSYYL